MKIASEMPVPHSLGKQFLTPGDIEEVKQKRTGDFQSKKWQLCNGPNNVKAEKITSKSERGL